MAKSPKPSGSLKVNRAPVLTLWAAVVAERLGHPPDAALSLASAVAGTAARAKARRLGIGEDDRPKKVSEKEPVRSSETVRLLGREISVTDGEDGTVLAADAEGKGAAPSPVRAYVERAFGSRLGEVRAAMENLAASYDPEELNRVGFRLYEAFRPEVPEGTRGWGAKGELRLDDISEAVAGTKSAR